MKVRVGGAYGSQGLWISVSSFLVVGSQKLKRQNTGITGVMCNFTIPLKNAGVPVFAISTWNTDYVLVPREKAALAVEALQADGWVFV